MMGSEDSSHLCPPRKRESFEGSSAKRGSLGPWGGGGSSICPSPAFRRSRMRRSTDQHQRNTPAIFLVLAPLSARLFPVTFAACRSLHRHIMEKHMGEKRRDDRSKQGKKEK